MNSELSILIFTAVGIAILHTAMGPDHYIPFISLSKTRGWSFGKTLFWVVVCGCGHVWSSVILGLGGAALGWSMSKFLWIENIRGGIASWALLLFGLIYGIWGLIRAYQNKPHKHFDEYDDGNLYVYEHRHGQAITAVKKNKVTPWVMFVIFLLGPCEPMIPLLFYPAVKNSWYGLMVLIVVYTIFTLATMLLMVILGYYGMAFVKTEKLERFIHAISGFALFICGAGMIFWGW